MTPALQNSVTIQLAFEPRICAFWNTVRGENERYQCISARFAYFVVPVSVGTFQLQLRGRCRRIKFQKLIGHSSSSLSTSELRPVIFNLNGERLQARYHASSAQVRSVRGGVLKLVRGFCYQGKRVYYSLASNGVASTSQVKPQPRDHRSDISPNCNRLKAILIVQGFTGARHWCTHCRY